jgi:uncharacterized protein
MMPNDLGHIANGFTSGREYRVVGKDETPAGGFMGGYLEMEDHHAGMLLLRECLRKFEGLKVGDAMPGKVSRNDLGEFYVIDGCADDGSYACDSAGCPDRDSARLSIVSNLRLLKGIGPGTERKLKTQGFSTLDDLVSHPKWGLQSKKFVQMLDGGDARCIQREMWHWLPRSDLLNLKASAFANMNDMVAIDIETLGLFSRPIILFGAAYLENGHIKTKQLLARDVEEEAPAIADFCGLIEGKPIISYNGRAFDVPYINQRRCYYDIGGDLDNLHFDMLPFARRAFKKELPDARLGTVERHLFGIKRSDDVPGAMVPEFYEEYLRTGNPGPLVPIVEHNRQDVISLAMLYSRMCDDGRY